MQIHFNRIYVIESLQPNDKLTGTDLHKDLLRYQSIVHSDFESILKNPVDKKDWNQLFKEIEKDCRLNGNSPIIHLEVHGEKLKRGLVLTSGELVTWEELYQNLVDINIAIKNELFITMAVCFGNFWLSSAFLNQPAAFRGIVGSFDELKVSDLVIRYNAFYQELFNSFDFNRAYTALKNSNPGLPNDYRCYSAEEIFALAFRDYEINYCSQKALRKRALVAANDSGCINRQERRKFEREFIKKEPQKRESYFQKCYQTFFMVKKYPELASTIEFGNSMREMKNHFKSIWQLTA